MEALLAEMELLREWGISQDLSDRQLDECLMQTLGRRPGGKDAPPTPSTADRHWARACARAALRCCQLTAMVALGGVLMFGCFYIVVSIHEPTAKTVLPYFQPLAYPLHKTIRMLSLPTSRLWDLSGVHHVDCLLPNPWFERPMGSCDTYKEVKAVATMSSQHVADFRQNNIGYVIPVVFPGLYKNVPTLGDFPETFRRHEKTFAAGSNLVCPAGGSTSLNTLMTSLAEDTLRGDFYADLHCHSVDAARVLRTLFPKPAFIPPDKEVSLDKFVSIEASHGPIRQLPPARLPNVFYMQATGTRRLLLAPNPACHQHCRGFEMTMQPGDIVYISSDFWNLLTGPVSRQSGDVQAGVSISLVGSFI